MIIISYVHMISFYNVHMISFYNEASASAIILIQAIQTTPTLVDAVQQILLY